MYVNCIYLHSEKCDSQFDQPTFFTTFLCFGLGLQNKFFLTFNMNIHMYKIFVRNIRL